jgi:CubicO group peptidase (beta-lactamase class C family)
MLPALRTLVMLATIFMLLSCGEEELFDSGNIYTGINHLDAQSIAEIDQIVIQYQEAFDYISLGILRDGVTELIRCYGEDRRGKSDEYASVSKPVTSVITLRLLEKGLIRSLDDPIGYYSSKYRDVLPERYPDVPITFSLLLSHRSGIPHHDRIWKEGKLDLQFEPGTDMLYSTRGYGVLGDVISMISGCSFNRLVKENIGQPLGASSIRCPLPFFEAPGGLIESTISDMAMFASGVMNGAYVSDSMMYQKVWVPYGSDGSGEMGLGWYIAHPGTPEMAVYHAGSNGKPRAFFVLKPVKKLGVVLLGRRTTEDGSQLFPELARQLVDLLEQLEEK